VPSLLAVDVGVRTGLAVYRGDGRLIWYRSRNFGAAARLKRAIPALLHEAFDPTYVVLEGGGPLAEHWATAAERQGAHVRRVSAEEWRSLFLLPREQPKRWRGRLITLDDSWRARLYRRIYRR